MLRISGTPHSRANTRTTLRLEGQVVGPWVAELRRICSELLGNTQGRRSHLVLDLSGVSFVDADGIVLFQELAQRQVAFRNGSSFIAEQLRGVADVKK